MGCCKEQKRAGGAARFCVRGRLQNVHDFFSKYRALFFDIAL
jgi:hypothetical protein